MKIGCISDLHGHLPKLPEDLDLLLIAGDICQHETIDKEEKFLKGPFLDWLNQYKFPKVGVAGNHDFYLEKNKTIDGIEILENSYEKIICPSDNSKYISIYGTPLSLEVGDWAYQASEEDIFRATANKKCDIILSHGPAYGLLDEVLPYGEHVGSISLQSYLQIEKPKVLVCGHIHESRNVRRYGRDTIIINASVVDRQYRAVHKVYVIDWIVGPMSSKVGSILEWDAINDTYETINL